MRFLLFLSGAAHLVNVAPREDLMLGSSLRLYCTNGAQSIRGARRERVVEVVEHHAPG